MSSIITELFSLEGQVAIVTGGTGVLGGAMAHGLARVGARVGILGRRRERAEAVVAEIEGAGGQAVALAADVLQHAQLETARDTVLERWGRVDILVNAAGGNVPAATLSADRRFWDLPREAFAEVFELNLLGTLLPSQVFGA
ncbi:MAG TPA: SDR family NAD(P)-dependent oxidoreductase, partial [Herpetosiphonaceae bacterium]